MKDAVDESSNPAELTISADLGIFTLSNEFDIKTTYEVEIIITTTDGVNPTINTVTGVSI
jgi:hypothetical protein